MGRYTLSLSSFDRSFAREVQTGRYRNVWTAAFRISTLLRSKVVIIPNDGLPFLCREIERLLLL